MSLDKAMHAIEESKLPSDVVEEALDALGFTQALHDLFVDVGILNSTEVNVSDMEKAFESLLGENAAAAIFLASFKDTETKLRKTAENLKDSTAVPGLVIQGYSKLASRVEKTRIALQDQ